MDILEEGLRKELLLTLGGKLDSELRFSKILKFSKFEEVLTRVGEGLDSLQKSIEYI